MFGHELERAAGIKERKLDSGREMRRKMTATVVAVIVASGLAQDRHSRLPREQCQVHSWHLLWIQTPLAPGDSQRYHGSPFVDESARAR